MIIRNNNLTCVVGFSSFAHRPAIVTSSLISIHASRPVSIKKALAAVAIRHAHPFGPFPWLIPIVNEGPGMSWRYKYHWRLNFE